jgi:dolichyl-phosphate-mannose-protein mannosyltransferase
MSRQLFIHHYLPSHLASALIAGSVLHFLLSETIDYPISIAGHFTVRRPSQWAELGTRGPIVVAGFFLALVFAFIYIAPLTYGTPGYASLTSAIST